MSKLEVLRRLLSLDRSGLAQAFQQGRPATLSAFHAAEPGQTKRLRGVSLGLPRLVERLSWKLFAKDVVVVEGEMRGWNVRLHQPAAVDASTLLSTPLRERGVFAPFAIGKDDRGHAVIDYRRSSNPFPLSHTIDPLVSLDDDDHVLLGVSDLHIARRVQRTPTWFVLFGES